MIQLIFSLAIILNKEAKKMATQMLNENYLQFHTSNSNLDNINIHERNNKLKVALEIEVFIISNTISNEVMAHFAKIKKVYFCKTFFVSYHT